MPLDQDPSWRQRGRPQPIDEAEDFFWNSSLGTATSANWNVTYRPWFTTLAPILTSFSRSVVSD